MSIKKLAIVSIPVKDQERAKSFYRDVLGLRVTHDDPFMPNGRRIELTPEGAETAITLVTWFDNMPAGCVQGLVLATNDIEAAHQALVARGLQIGSIESASWGRYATFNDLDGNGWIIQQFAASGA